MRSTKASFYESLNPLQFGFEFKTERYVQQTIAYGAESVLFYQFAMKAHTFHIPVVPDGCIDLLFCCDPNRPIALICGSVLEGSIIDFLPGTEYFGIRLTPKLSLRLRGLPFRETLAQKIPLQDMMKGIATIPGEIAERDKFGERIAVIERRVLHVLFDEEHDSCLLDYCLQRLYQSGGLISVEQLASDTGYTSRFLRKKFEHSLGIPPKQYSRIIRLQNALRLMKFSADLSDISADQALPPTLRCSATSRIGARSCSIYST